MGILHKSDQGAASRCDCGILCWIDLIRKVTIWAIVASIQASEFGGFVRLAFSDNFRRNTLSASSCDASSSISMCA